MKKIIVFLMITSMICVVFAGCIKQTENTKHRLDIVSTVYPGYDFAKHVAGDNAKVTLLLPPGTESHSYDPTPQDIIRIQNCDLFICVGGKSENWISDILASFDDAVTTVKMMDCVQVVEEEIVEGMEEDREHDHDHGEAEYDEHVWTSPVNARLILTAISDAVCASDPDLVDIYRENTDSYMRELEELDKDFINFFSTVSDKTLIFGDRFPLRYFVETYGLDYYAAFPGCASQTEPNAKTIAFLIDKVKTEEISTVFYIEFSNHLVADSIAEAANVKTACFHTCHNVTRQQLDEGVTYIDLMRANLNELKKAMK